MRITLLVALMLIVLAGVAVSEENPAIGEPIAPFQLEALAGGEFNSEERLNGRVAVIAFWRCGQETSESLLNDLKLLAKEFQDKPVEFVTICSGDMERERITDVATRLELPYPVLLDPGRHVYEKFGVFVSPASAIVDQQGRLRFYRPGHYRDFLSDARLDLKVLTGAISAKEHTAVRVRSENASESHSHRFTAHYRLALIMYSMGDTESGRSELEKAWSQGEGHPMAGLRLGFLCLKDGDWERAKDLFNGLEHSHPEFMSQSRVGKALALLQAGEKQGGDVLIRRILAEENHDLRFYHETGELCELAGALEQAVVFYRMGLDLAMSRQQEESP